MINLPRFLYLIAFLAGSCYLFGKSPEVRTEVREESGKKVTFMYIDGIKVHETDPSKQPFPPVVEPKPYDAGKAKAPENAVVLFDGSQASINNWSAMNGQPTQWKLEDGALVSNKEILDPSRNLVPARYTSNLPLPNLAKVRDREVGTVGCF